MGGFRRANCRPVPRSAVHLTLSDRLGFFFFFVGGCGLSFMGCNELMLVGYGGRCGLIFVVWLILDFSYGGRW